MPRYAATMAELRAHKGMTVEQADKDLLDPNLFAVMMVRQGDADAVLGGLTTPYPDTVRPALQLIKLEQGRSIAAAIYVVVVSGRPYFFADCAVNIEPIGRATGGDSRFHRRRRQGPIRCQPEGGLHQLFQLRQRRRRGA